MNLDLQSKYPPCIRAIVQKSDVFPIGTLFIVPYTGGNIGSDPKDSLICIDDESISSIHSNIYYDKEKKRYKIKLCKKNVAYLNEKLIDKKIELKHADILRVSETVFLLHIHSGANTCINCEPGEVMAKASKQESNFIGPNLSAADKEKLRRNRNLEIKKKYVILIEILTTLTFLLIDLAYKNVIMKKLIKVY
jgi:hypothetical protein